MTLLERLGKKENKNNGKIFAGRTDKIIEQGYQDLKIAVHRRIVDEMTSEQQQLFEGTNHSRQEVEALISTYVERVLSENPFAVPRGERARLVSDICDEILGSWTDRTSSEGRFRHRSHGQWAKAGICGTDGQTASYKCAVP